MLGFKKIASKITEKGKQKHRVFKAANRTDCPGCGNKKRSTKEEEEVQVPVVRGPLAALCNEQSSTSLPPQINAPAEASDSLFTSVPVVKSDWYYEPVTAETTRIKKRQHRAYKQSDRRSVR